MKKLSVSIFALAALVLTACSDKESYQEPDVSGEPVLTTFRIESPRTYQSGPPETGSEQENKINMLEFYIFNASGQRDEVTDAHNFAYYKHEGSVYGEISFLVQAGLSKKILLAVNCDLGELENMNYSELEKKAASVVLSNSNSQSVGDGNFMMSGKAICDVMENSTENEVTIQISRLLSKFEAPKLNPEFKVNIPDEDLQGIFADENLTKGNVTFDLLGYALINGYTKSHIFTYYNDEDKVFKPWSNWNPDGIYYPTAYDASNNNNIQTAYSGIQDGSPWLTDRNVFVYEHQPVEITDEESGIVGYKKEQVYAFLIKGLLTNTTNGDELTRFWRVNLILDDNYTIYRNTIYRVTLDEVRTPGYGTPKEGEEDEDGGNIVPKNDQTGIQATIEIVPWSVKLQNTHF